jgi:hypothetical protein
MHQELSRLSLETLLRRILLETGLVVKEDMADMPPLESNTMEPYMEVKAAMAIGGSQDPGVQYFFRNARPI